MVYYNLESPYEGDETKKCGLTIDEVDKNFFQLEQYLNENVKKQLEELGNTVSSLEEKIEELEKQHSVFSITVHDGQICPPGTSNNAIYTPINRYTMRISGKINYYKELLPDGSEKGNRFGVAIKPIIDGARLAFPNATFQIFDNIEYDLWPEINGNPSGWPEALYLYPKVERIDGNIKVSLGGFTKNTNEMVITINWNEVYSETYKYIVDEDVELETVVSYTCHDKDICEPGTSDDATYLIDQDDKYTMHIGGTVYYNSDYIPGTEEEKGYRVGLAIVPYSEATRETYPNAEWFINDYSKGNFWDSVDDFEDRCTQALYFYPKLEQYCQGVLVSLSGRSNATNTLNIKIQWNDEISETYTYIIDENINLVDTDTENNG